MRSGEERRIELPSVAVDVAEGESLLKLISNGGFVGYFGTRTGFENVLYLTSAGTLMAAPWDNSALAPAGHRS